MKMDMLSLAIMPTSLGIIDLLVHMVGKIIINVDIQGLKDLVMVTLVMLLM